MKPKFSAFHGKQEIKDKYIARMKTHILADELIHGTGFKNGKGCAIGCTIDKYSHIGYEEELEIPFTIAIIEDRIFESLSVEKSKDFPLEFLESVNVGSDLSKVYNKIEVFNLELLKQKLKDEEIESCEKLIILHNKVIEDIETKESEWKTIYYLEHYAYLAHHAYLADFTYRADRADLAYRARLGYLSYRADHADIIREKFIQLIKETK